MQNRLLMQFQAHFQCLINLCSAKSYGSALMYSISVCSATGANIIPLHPIEVRQPQSHTRSLLDGQDGQLSMTTSQILDLARNFAMGLTCNTGGDGFVTVSLDPQDPSATPSIFEKSDGKQQSHFTRKFENTSTRCCYLCMRLSS